MKKSGLAILKIVFSVGILAYIFTRVVRIGDLWANLREAQLSYLAIAVVIYFMVQTVSAFRWYLLLKPLGIEISFPRILALYFLGMYFNFFLPSSIGGDVFRVYYLNKETGRLSASTASVFLDRDIGMGGLLLTAVVVLAASSLWAWTAWLAQGFQKKQIPRTSWAFGACLLMTYLSLWALHLIWTRGRRRQAAFRAILATLVITGAPA